MSVPAITRDLAWSAAQDAANTQMRAAGRSKWSQDDYRLAVETFDRLWPEERDYTERDERDERGEVPVCRTPVHCGHVHHINGDPTNNDLDNLEVREAFGILPADNGDATTELPIPFSTPVGTVLRLQIPARNAPPAPEPYPGAMQEAVATEAGNRNERS